MAVNQVAVGIIRDINGKLCLSKRKKNVHLAGYWEFPGGKVEPDESPEIALNRELFEEVGISVGEFELIDMVYFDYGAKQVELHFFLIKSYQGIVTAKENQEIIFVLPNELRKYQLPEANYSVIDKLIW